MWSSKLQLSYSENNQVNTNKSYRSIILFFSGSLIK